MSKKEATPLYKALESVARSLDAGNQGRLLQLKMARTWLDVAGDTVASHTAGVHLRGGELIVQVDSPVWATELSALSEKYREAINLETGGRLVRTIRFTVSKEAFKSIKRAFEEDDAESDVNLAPPPVALSEQERRQVEDSASVIPDKELRQAVVRATVADLEWKKGMRAAKGREAASHES